MIKRLNRIVLLLLLFQAGAQASVLEMKVFGDSLSDTGNMFALSSNAIPPLPPYFAGRFSNGFNWIDQVAAIAGAGPVNNAFETLTLTGGVDNFAVGGAYSGTFPFPTNSANSNDLRLPVPTAVFPGLQQQVDTYRVISGNGALVNPTAWHVLWAGANDLIFAPIVIDTDPTTMANVAIQAVTNIGTAIGDLYGLGAREFMLFNLPDIGATPFGDLTGLAPLLTFGSGVFNSELTNLISSLPTLYPEIDVMLFDVGTLFSDLLSEVTTDPTVMAMFPDAGVQAFVADGLSFCFDQDGLTGPAGAYYCNSSDPDDRIFFDLVHPSSRTHGLIAAAVVEAKVPEPGTLGLCLLALLGAGFRRKVRRRSPNGPAGLP